MGSTIFIRPVTISSVSWTPITAYLDCDSMIIRNPNNVDVKLREDQADAGTEETLLAGDEIEFTMPRRPGGNTRYEANQVLVYAQSTVGSVDLVRRGISQ